MASTQRDADEAMMKAFKRAAEWWEGSCSFDLIDAILHERPELTRDMADVSKQGDAGHIVVFGNEVFKGPKGQNYEGAYNNEYKLLQSLEDKGLPVPVVTYVGKETVFYGMTRLPGETLGLDYRQRLNEEELQNLARDIIDFTISLAKALPQKEGGRFAMHDDLHPGNILIDPETKRLTGVIDFGPGLKYVQKKNWSYHRCFDGIGRQLQAEFDKRQCEIPDLPGVAYDPAKRSPTLDFQRRAPW